MTNAIGPLSTQLKVIKDYARKEIPDFVRAHMVAEAEHGNRYQLINLYDRIMIDGNLTRDVNNRKAKVLGALGVRRIKQICAELDQGGDFKCGKVFGTGASGTVRNFLSSALCGSAYAVAHELCRMRG